MKYILLLFTCFSFAQFNPIFFYQQQESSTPPRVAYSLRKVNSVYIGNCIKVRRSSDNAEQDIGFVSGVIDTSSLTAFVGANTGYVTTWYDQSGNVKDLVQTNTSLQPTIIKAGVLNTLSGLPAIECLSQVMDASNVTLGNGSNDIMSGVVVCQHNSQGGAIGATGFSGYHHFRKRTSTTEIRNNGTVAASFSGIPSVQQNLFTMVRYDASNVRYYLNNSLIGSAAMDGSWGTRTLAIGSFINGTTDIMYQEIIYYASDVSSSLSAIHSNINSYYTIY